MKKIYISVDDGEFQILKERIQSGIKIPDKYLQNKKIKKGNIIIIENNNDNSSITGKIKKIHFFDNIPDINKAHNLNVGSVIKLNGCDNVGQQDDFYIQIMENFLETLKRIEGKKCRLIEMSYVL